MVVDSHPPLHVAACVDDSFLSAGYLVLLLLRHQSLQWIPPTKPQERAKVHDQIVEHDEGAGDAHVAPHVAVVYAELARAPRVAAAVLAVLAEAVAAGLDVPLASHGLDEGSDVGLARLSRRGGEAGELVGLAFQWQVVN